MWGSFSRSINVQYIRSGIIRKNKIYIDIFLILFLFLPVRRPVSARAQAHRRRGVRLAEHRKTESGCAQAALHIGGADRGGGRVTHHPGGRHTVALGEDDDRYRGAGYGWVDFSFLLVFSILLFDSKNYNILFIRSLRRHPWPILRFNEAVRGGRISSHHQIPVSRRLRRSGIL